MTGPVASVGDRREHPSSSELAAFCAGRVSGVELERIAAHVAACEACGRQLIDGPADSLVQLARVVHENSGRRGASSGAAAQSLADTRVGSASSASDNGFVAMPGSVAGDVPVELRDHPRFEILGELGRGGMGIVYRARHRMMNRDVALKVIHPKFTSHRQAVERFRQEVRASAKLKHPNIVTAFDAEQCGELLVLVMEFIEGRSLAELVLRDGPMSSDAACDAIRQACAGLQHAHSHGLTHRDIKPQNLIRTSSGEVRILDFGLARLEDHAAVSQTARTVPNLTMIGAMLGTPDFMAPEQAMDSSSADARSDVYSLGATLFYLLTAELPFGAVDGNEFAAMMDRRLRWSDAARARVPTELVPILERMTAANPADRYASTDDASEAIVAAGSASAIPIRTTSPISSVREHLPSPVTVPSSVPVRSVRQKQRPVLDRRVTRLSSPQRSSRRKWIVFAYLVAALVAVSAPFVSSLWRGENVTGSGTRESSEDSRSGGTARESEVSRLPLQEGPEVSQLPLRDEAQARVLLVVSATDFQWSNVNRLMAAWQPAPRVRHLASWTNPVAIMQRPDETAKVDRLLSDVRADDYDVIIVAGAEGMMHLTESNADHDAVLRLITSMLSASKPVGAMGAGPGVLASVGVLDGVRATGHPYFHDDVRTRFGVELFDEPVIRSGRIVTARDLNASAEFVREIRAVLRSSGDR